MSILTVLFLFVRRVISVPYGRTGTGKAPGWYGGRVCSFEVCVCGPCRYEEEVARSLCGSGLKNVKFQLDKDTEQDYDAKGVGNYLFGGA